MEHNSEPSRQVSKEQNVYAAVLQAGMLVGLVTLFVTFAIYVFGILKPYIPIDKISQYWIMDRENYLHSINLEPGWAWITMVGYGDFVNFISVVILAGVTIICYMAIIPVFLKEKEILYLSFAVIECIVLVLAASGVLISGH